MTAKFSGDMHVLGLDHSSVLPWRTAVILVLLATVLGHNPGMLG